VLGVSSRGYYYWVKYPGGFRVGKEQQLLATVKKVNQQIDGPYGSPCIAAANASSILFSH
jgi:hypothetical protein